MYMRLTGWLNRICSTNDIPLEVLYLAISILNRYISSTKLIKPNKFQLVGIACLWISDKFDDYNSNYNIAKLLYNNLEFKDLIQMEFIILTSLSFDINIPTIFTFLNRYLNYVDNDIIRNMSYFISERCLQSVKMINHLPSCIASSCIIISLKKLNKRYLTYNFIEYSSLKCINDIQNILLHQPKNEFLIEKYKLLDLFSHF